MYFEAASLSEILDDLCSRFIINVPDEELASVERICFQIEQAHWFYEDFIREINSSLPTFTLKNFSAKIFKHCPLLHQWANEHEKAYNDFLQYKFRVPVCGAIILNENQDKCLLVKGWNSRSGWGFPRGKINKDEPDSTCAIREVLEETGFDINPYIRDNQFIEVIIHEQRIKLFIVPGVPESTAFTPLTRKEISKIEWHKISDLPASKVKSGISDLYKAETPSTRGNDNSYKSTNRYYMVIPFVTKLKSWISRRNKGKSSKRLNSLRSSQSSSQLSAANNQADAERQIKSLLGLTDGQGNAQEYQTNNGPVPNTGQNHVSRILERKPNLINNTDPEYMLKSMLRISDSTPSLPITQSPSPSYVSYPSQQMPNIRAADNSNQPSIPILIGTPDKAYCSNQHPLSHALYTDRHESGMVRPLNKATTNSSENPGNQLKLVLGITNPANSPTSTIFGPTRTDIDSFSANNYLPGKMHPHNSYRPPNSNSQCSLSMFGKSPYPTDVAVTKSSISNVQSQVQTSKPSAQSLLSLFPGVNCNSQTALSNHETCDSLNRRTSQTTANAANELLGLVSSQSLPQSVLEAPNPGQNQIFKKMLGIHSTQHIGSESLASPSSDQLKSLLNIDSQPMMAQ